MYEKCDTNYKILKRDLGLDCTSCYFLDYYFPEKNLCLEIDGKQHEIEERKLSDSIRDKALKESGIDVYRIKWKSINTESGKNYIKKEIDKFLQYYKNI